MITIVSGREFHSYVSIVVVVRIKKKKRKGLLVG